MRIGIVGLPNVGKSSLFNLLTKAGAKVDLYPFTTIEKNVGMVIVPDERLQKIGKLLKPPKLTPATIEFVDIAGLVKGASKGEGLGNKFLSHVRETHLLLHLLRSFSDASIPHVYGDVDPERDMEIVNAELAVTDLEIVERNLSKLTKETKTLENQVRIHTLEKVKQALSKGFEPPVLNHEEAESIKEMGLFMVKPTIYGLNCSDSAAVDLNAMPKLKNRDVFSFSAILEEEIEDFSEEEKRQARRDLNLAEAGPAGIVEQCFQRLNLIRFYTVKGEESRAWSIPKGTKIVDAAGKIHSDFAEGFIKAEVVAFNDLATSGNFHLAKEHGKFRIEGKNYEVKDGDVVLIKFKT
ncbi:MAG: redox-regulated ATPase YchF [candidate division WOR-3 bacterium]|nr:redox-regulated ATPase YchF [candidate division WOR-3 bacterium]